MNPGEFLLVGSITCCYEKQGDNQNKAVGNTYESVCVCVLPVKSLSRFKSKLKTYFFHKAFD